MDSSQSIWMENGQKSTNGNGSLVADLIDRLIPDDGGEGTSDGELPFGKELLDILPAAVYVCDCQGVIRYYNRHAATLWGQEPECGDVHQRFCGAYRLYYLDGSYMAHASTPMADAIREGRPQRNREVIFERPNGSRITVLVNIKPLRNRQGELIGAVNVMQDISERTHAEQARAYLAAIVESSDDAILSKTLDGIITSWNGGAERLYGYSASEVVGQSVSLDYSCGSAGRVDGDSQSAAAGRVHKTLRNHPCPQRRHPAGSLGDGLAGPG